MRAWAIVDDDSERTGDQSPYRNGSTYVLFHYDTFGDPYFQVFDHRHKEYALNMLDKWRMTSHPTARLVEVELTLLPWKEKP